MRPFTKVVAFSLLMSAIVAIPSSRAQWISQDLSICTAPGIQNGPAIATDKLGNTFIAWEDYRDNPYSTDAAIYMQKLDASGSALWAPDGVIASTTMLQKDRLCIVPDDVGGAYIAFELDSVALPQCYQFWVSRIALSRVSSDGTLLWSMHVSNITGLRSEAAPIILPDGSGGVVLIWLRFEGFSSWDCGVPVGLCCSWSSISVCAQRIDPDGGRPWGLTPVTVAPSGAMGEIKAVKADSNSAIVVWSSGGGSFADIHAQKLGMDGSLLWGASGDTVCAYSGGQSAPALAPDGLGGAIIIWRDGRNELGTYGHPYIYGQRLDAAGARMWAPDGAQVGSAQGPFNEIGLAPGGQGEWIVRWISSTTPGSTPYAQKIDIGGNVLWSPGGIPVSTAVNSKVEDLRAVSDGEGGAVFAWERITPPAREPALRGMWGTSQSDIFAVGDRGYIYHYDGLAWAKIESGTTANLYGVWGFASTDVYAVGAGGVILHYNGLGWSAMTSGTTKDLRGVWGSSTSDVFAVGASGTIIHYDGAIWIPMDYSLGGEIYGVYGTSGTNVYAVGDYNHRGMMLHYDGVSWQQSQRLNFWYRSIWMSPEGEIFMGGFYYALGGAVFRDAGNGLEVTRVDAYETGCGTWGSSGSDVYVAFNGGSLAHYDGSGWSLSKVSTNGLNAVWGASGSDVWVAGYQITVRHSEGSAWATQMQQNYDIYAQRVNGGGTRLWLDEGAPVAVSIDDQAEMALGSDWDGSALVAWSDGRYGNWDILSRKISISRGPTVETELLAFSAEPIATGIRVAWELSRFDEEARFDVARKTGPEEGAWGVILPRIERNGLGFSFDDLGLAPGTGYRYRIDIADTKGVRLLFEMEAVSMPAPPLTLYQNFPNPFNPVTAIHYSLPEKCHVALSIYSVSGKVVALLVDTEQLAGSHRIEWNGKDTQGKQASSGVYFYRLTAGKKTISKKMVLLR